MGRVLNSLEKQITGETTARRKDSGNCLLCLRKNNPLNSVYVNRTALVYNIIQTTGMRFAECRKINIDNIGIDNSIIMPSTKKGKTHKFQLTDYQNEMIIMLGEKTPFLHSPQYRSVYNYALNHGTNETTIFSKKNRSILSGLRKLKIRNLIQNSETAKRLSNVFGWKTPSSIGYYL